MKNTFTTTTTTSQPSSSSSFLTSSKRTLSSSSSSSTTISSSSSKTTFRSAIVDFGDYHHNNMIMTTGSSSTRGSNQQHNDDRVVGISWSNGKILPRRNRGNQHDKPSSSDGAGSSPVPSQKPTRTGKEEQNQEQEQVLNRSCGVRRCGGYDGWRRPILTHVGMYNPIARTNVTFPQSRFASVLQLLMDCFRAMSLQTVFHDTAPVRAICTTLEHNGGQISIQFWKQQKQQEESNYDDDDDVVIMEITRVAGDSMVCQRYIRHLMNVVTTRVNSGSGEEEMGDSTADPVPPPKLDEDMRQQQQSVYHNKVDSLVHRTATMAGIQLPGPLSHDDDIVWDGLKIAQELMTSERVDGLLLGLESLVSLTDPYISGIRSATIARKYIMTGQQQHTHNDTGFATTTTRRDYSQIRETILHLVMVGGLPGNNTNDGGNSMMGISYTIDRGYLSRSCYLSRLVLAQCVDWATRDDLLVLVQEVDRLAGRSMAFVHRLAEIVTSVTQTTTSTLMFAEGDDYDDIEDNDDDGSRPTTRPTTIHDAYLATRILSVICRHMPGMVRSTLSLDVVRDVRQVGELCHAALSHESSNLWQALMVATQTTTTTTVC